MRLLGHLETRDNIVYEFLFVICAFRFFHFYPSFLFVRLSSFCKNVKVDHRRFPFSIRKNSFSAVITRALVSRATARAKLQRCFFSRINPERTS